MTSHLRTLTTVLIAAGICSVNGCAEEPPTAPDQGRNGVFAAAQAAPTMVPITYGSETLNVWPYTGNALDGTPIDPLHLVFVGNADPVRIRAALLALDGDRTAFGFPDEYPFNMTWGEAMGDVHTTYAEDEWGGSVIQLQLGGYENIRVHLRIFGTGVPYGDDGVWTLAAAHFEVLIPGTADHQVLSWTIPRDLVVADLARSGLLGGAPQPTDVINAQPSWREIPTFIYDNLPPALQAMVGGPPAPAPGPVPITSDGRAIIIPIAGAAEVIPEERQDTINLTYQQVVPRPFCSDGPYDWVLVQGPVSFQKFTTVDEYGMYTYQYGYNGHLTITPMDILQDPPVPVGAPFSAVVNGTQNGLQNGAQFRVLSQDRRIGPQDGGTEMEMTRLRVASQGALDSSSRSKCLE